MKKEYPLITIGFTCHNAEDTIAAAIESAFQQTWPNIDILVVDDGSSDSSVAVVQAIAEKDKRVRLIVHSENQGTAIARNTIAQNAQGEFLAFFDDDDKSVPERLEKQWGRIVRYEEAHGTNRVFCYCNRYIVRRDGRKAEHIGYGMGRVPPEPHGEELADIILWGRTGEVNRASQTGQMGSGTMMMRTAAFEEIGLFDERFRRSAEIDLAVRAAFKGYHFISVDEPLMTQYKTASSDKAGRKPLTYLLLLREKNKDYLKKKRVYWASIAFSYATFHHNHKWKKNMFFALFCMLAPVKIFWPRVKRRLMRWRGGVEKSAAIA